MTDGKSTAVGSTTYASTARAYAFAYAPAPIFAAVYSVLVTGARSTACWDYGTRAYAIGIILGRGGAGCLMMNRAELAC